MPRTARIVAAGYPHHITQRGNYRQEVFSERNDYIQYLQWLSKFSIRYEVSTLCYSLVPNHVHHIVIPKKEDSLSRTFNICHMRYSQYFNKRNDMKGHLWQGRFYSCVLDEAHLYAAVRYVENNPVRAGLVKKAEDWEWSSARYHLTNGIDKGSGILPLADINAFIEVADWKEYLCEENNDKIIADIRNNTLSGMPLGDDAFVSRLEKLFGRRLKSLPKGRPKSTKNGDSAHKRGTAPIMGAVPK